jgi:hypothetical protein
MFRIAAVVLALAVGVDQFLLNGKYTAATQRAAIAIFYHLR